jgi:hypothetical protein
MIEFLSDGGNGQDELGGGQIPAAVSLLSNRIGDQLVAAGADGDQVVLHRLVGDPGIAGGPVVDLERIGAAIFVAETAAEAIEGQPGPALGRPEGRGNVLFIGHSGLPFSAGDDALSSPARSRCSSMLKRISWVMGRRLRLARAWMRFHRSHGTIRGNRCVGFSIAQI